MPVHDAPFPHQHPHLLLLGGTTEAAALARALAEAVGDRLTVTYSIAGRVSPRTAPPGRLRSGGFAGAEGMAAFLRSDSVTMLVDATHPFAARISRNAHLACEVTGTPRLILRRPPWQPCEGDRWVEVDTVEEAAAAAGAAGRRAFVTLGAVEISAFSRVPGLTCVVRLLEEPEEGLGTGATVVTGRGPFDAAAEEDLMRAHGVDVLVTKASGGAATEAKLVAARRLGLPVVMLRRPPEEPGAVVETVAEAVAWVRSYARL